MRIHSFMVFLFSLVLSAEAATLEEAFADFRQCKFNRFYYEPWDTKQTVHPYITERKLTPYKEEDGLYYFKVKDTLYGLPVSEIIIPGTWDLHAVVFDVPLDKAQKVIKNRFGEVFAPSPKSLVGEAPALETAYDDPNRSSLYCNEAGGGE